MVRWQFIDVPVTYYKIHVKFGFGVTLKSTRLKVYRHKKVLLEFKMFGPQ